MPRRRSPFSDDFFADFDRLEEIFEQMFRQMGAPQFHRHLSREPLVYGVNIRISPQGGARIEPFGNVNVQEQRLREEREPLVDVMEERDSVRAIVELPGASKDSIRLEIRGSQLEANAQSSEQKFRKVIRLPAEVLGEGSKASFKNGILEVILRKKPASKPGRTAEIRLE